ncbi:FAD-dependent oxidoreductase [Hyphomicrobium sp. LHD-15]|uniref:NAD(P)/FAD-dependent oxidoreductase n=1 Tax=Hyphomicrobium sp. LHD-15 TaxID=3072142 RepID=UPI00281089A1|nr:FAD-dependent oxidoreductase [Hyphomicrobium sp. LHD-15]MDQ8699219.1 FAD-dependent oxidoreductase [Hyphomicrobium sp. LHD-15]
MSGALVALKLAEQGHDVVVVDRRAPCRGSTLASTAMIQFELDTTLSDLADKIGAARAERAYSRSFRSVRALGDLIARLGVSCGWKERNALYLAGTENGWRALEAEADYRAKIGLPSTFLDGSSLKSGFGIARTGAILSEGAAEANPVQLATACLRAARRLGARVYAPHNIRQAYPHAQGVDLETEEGATISARRAIFTTGYEVVSGVPRAKFDITSTWAIATRPLAAASLWPARCLIWEASDPYLYLRTTYDNRILAGGEDSGLQDNERRDAAISNKAHRLLHKIEDLLPGRRLQIDYAWAGAFADSPTGLPHMSPVEGLANCFAVLGCGGNGITFSVIAADVVAAWVAGRTDRDADLFC